MDAMEYVRLEPLGQHPLGADSAGFRMRARKEYFDNRAAQAQNRVPQVMPFHTAPTPGWVPPKAQVAMDQLAAAPRELPVAGRRASRDSGMGALAPPSGGSGASAGSRGSGVMGQGLPDMPAAGRRSMNRSQVIDGATSGGWQGWNKPQAIDAYGMGRSEQKRNRWANDTPAMTKKLE
jgi:hypothetical protein